jgi:hypothetical protein
LCYIDVIDIILPHFKSSCILHVSRGKILNPELFFIKHLMSYLDMTLASSKHEIKSWQLYLVLTSSILLCAYREDL